MRLATGNWHAPCGFACQLGSHFLFSSLSFQMFSVFFFLLLACLHRIMLCTNKHEVCALHTCLQQTPREAVDSSSFCLAARLFKFFPRNILQRYQHKGTTVAVIAAAA